MSKVSKLQGLEAALEIRVKDLANWEKQDKSKLITVKTSLRKHYSKKLARIYRRNNNAGIGYKEITVKDKIDKCKRDITSIKSKIKLFNSDFRK